METAIFNKNSNKLMKTVEKLTISGFCERYNVTYPTVVRWISRKMIDHFEIDGTDGRKKKIIQLDEVNLEKIEKIFKDKRSCFLNKQGILVMKVDFCNHFKITESTRFTVYVDGKNIVLKKNTKGQRLNGKLLSVTAITKNLKKEIKYFPLNEDNLGKIVLCPSS